MKNWNTTKKILLIIALLDVLVFGAYGFLLWSIHGKTGQVSALFSEAERDLKKDEELRAIQISLDENRGFLDRLDSYFIAPTGVVAFIESIEQFAEESGVALSIGSVIVEPSENPADFKETLRLHLEAKGSWAGVFHFMSVLESLPFHIELNGVSLTLSSAAESILFTDGGSGRIRSPEEIWNGSFDLSVLKLK